MKKYLSLLLALCLTLSLAACGSKTDSNADAAGNTQTGDNATEQPADEPVELIVFAAASMTETMNTLKETYQQATPISPSPITSIPPAHCSSSSRKVPTAICSFPPRSSRWTPLTEA